MSFRQRQHFHPAHYVHVVEKEYTEKPDGRIQSDLVSRDETVLPDPALFDLQSQLKAGIALEEVNSKVVQSKTVNADTVVRKYTKKSTNEEVNNED